MVGLLVGLVLLLLCVLLFAALISSLSSCSLDLSDPDTGAPQEQGGCLFDVDDDGFCGDDECDDFNASIHVGAQEVCDADERDEDCDGLRDDDDPSATGQSTLYLDADLDGYGDASQPFQRCHPSRGITRDDTDIDDSDSRVWTEDGVYTGDVTGDYNTVCQGARSVTVIGSILLSNGSEVKLSHLACVVSITGDLGIVETRRLTSLEGLEQLGAVGGSLTLQGTALTDISALSGLTEIPGDLIIADNPALASLAGLEGVAAIGGSLTLADNAALSSLDGLAGLTAVEGDITATGNLLLCDQAKDALLAQLTGFDGLAVWEGNAGVCP